jgi:hypothetical protein
MLSKQPCFRQQWRRVHGPTTCQHLTAQISTAMSKTFSSISGPLGLPAAFGTAGRPEPALPPDSHGLRPVSNRITNAKNEPRRFCAKLRVHFEQHGLQERQVGTKTLAGTPADGFGKRFLAHSTRASPELRKCAENDASDHS